MADAAGALLLRAGVINPQALSAASALKQREGGTLGEALIRLGHIDEDRLVSVFQQSLLIPRISAAVLQRIPRQVVATIPASMAVEFRVVPVELDSEGNLTLAMADPTENRAVDEVAAHTGRFVMRAVASPAAVRDALFTHYGVTFTASEPMGASVVKEPRPAKGPGRADSSRRNTLPPASRVVPEAALPSARPPSAMLAALARAVVVERTPTASRSPGKSGKQAGATPVRQPGLSASDPILLTQPVHTPAPPGATWPGVGGQGTDEAVDARLLAPVARLHAAATRDEVVALLLDYAGLLAARVGLFVVQRGQLVCLDGRGPDHVVVAMKWFTIPVDTPSPFRDVLQSRTPYIGSLQDNAESRAFRNALGSSSGELLLLPLLVGDRVVGVLYADEIRMDLAKLSAELLTLSQEAGAAFVRIILNRKQRPS